MPQPVWAGDPADAPEPAAADIAEPDKDLDKDFGKSLMPRSFYSEFVTMDRRV
jgi:hypothetical protein